MGGFGRLSTETAEVGAAVGALVVHVHTAVYAAWNQAAAAEASAT